MNQLLARMVCIAIAPAAIAQCPIAPTGNAIVAPKDAWTAAQPLGFAFPFAGSTYTHVYISDHSLLALNNAGTPAAPPNASFLWSPAVNNLVAGGPMIAPYWSDHTTTLNGTVMIDNASGTSCTITWHDHQTYLNQQPPFSVQVTLYDTGTIEMRLDNRVDNRGSTFGALNAIVGLSPGAPSALPPAADLTRNATTTNATVFEEWSTQAAGTPNPSFDVSNSMLTFTPQTSGWQVVRQSLGCAAATEYGDGCEGIALTSNAPVLGGLWDIAITGLTVSPIGLYFFGTARLDPEVPLWLLGLNAPGCSIYVDGPYVTGAVPATAGVAAASLPVPLTTSLAGWNLPLQGIALTTANPANLATSNGVEVVFGY